MLSDKEYKRISKFLSLVLRHKPELIGIVLDQNGWTNVDVLIAGCERNDVILNKEILEHVVLTNAKKRFAFDETHGLIRANQGHSVVVDLAYTVKRPPEILYHGTSIQYLDGIFGSGLQKMQRHHVHLSTEINTAVSVGARHGKPVVFQVLAGEMFKEGYQFFQSENNVWLTDQVPTRYLEILPKDLHP